MEMTGEQLIPAPQQTVWSALNDPQILKECVPGCESIELVGDNEYRVLMTSRIGPVSAKFKGKLLLSDVQAPNSYSISFEGQGGAVGFAKGSAKVALSPDGGSTKLTYSAKANIGGKLAQIGSRLIDAAANMIARQFFEAFNEKVAARHAADPASKASSDGAEDEHHPKPVPDDPGLPKASDSSMIFLAGGLLVVFTVSLFSLFA